MRIYRILPAFNWSFYGSIYRERRKKTTRIRNLRDGGGGCESTDENTSFLALFPLCSSLSLISRHTRFGQKWLMEEHRARGTMSCGDLRLLVKSKRKRRAKNSELSSTPAPTRWRLRMWEIAKNKREKFSSSLWNAGSYVLGTNSNSRFISTVCAGKTFIWSFRERERVAQTEEQRCVHEDEMRSRDEEEFKDK